MKHFAYDRVPTCAQFQKDSSISLAVRREDRILCYLDFLLERYAYYDRGDDYSTRRIVLCELFTTTNYWIKSYHEGRPRFLKERYPSVLALFEATVAQLCVLLQCTRPQVAIEIEEIFGRDLTEEGKQTDARMDAHMFDLKERALYRIRFKNGVAYHFGLNADPGSLKLKPLKSADFFTSLGRRRNDTDVTAKTFPGWAPFVMTLEREFFMTKHWLNDPDKKNVFHSSYTKGATICAAGTIEVKKGIITGLRPDSGHYKPLEHNFVATLLALKMFGVDTSKIKVFDWKGDLLGSAKDFVSKRLTWSTYQDARTKHIDQRPPVPVPYQNA